MAEIEKSFSSILSKWHGQEIVVIFSDDQLMALGYHQALGVVQQTPIDLTTMMRWNIESSITTWEKPLIIKKWPSIKKILVHLHLYTEPKQRAPPTPKTIIREYESYDDGWPGYEESFVDVNSFNG